MKKTKRTGQIERELRREESEDIPLKKPKTISKRKRKKKRLVQDSLEEIKG